MKIKSFRNNAARKLLCFLLASVFLVQCKNEDISPAPQAKPQQAEERFSITPPTSAPGYNVEKSLPAGYVKDGSVDYTPYIQKAIDTYSEIVFPGFPLLVNDRGLIIGSNKKITFLKGSRIFLKPTAKASYAILRIRNATNVTLNYPVIYGDRFKHLGTDGQYGMGISIVSSSNITLVGPRVFECWGDGIYMSSVDNILNKNIRISYAYCKNNRRDGMSVLCVDGLELTNSYFGYNNGTLPMTGLNFEPSNNKQELKNIRVSNIKTEKNGLYGVLVMFNYLYGNGNKQIDIEINNHTDERSKVGMKASCLTTYRTNGETISGNVKLGGSYWKYNPERAVKTTLYDKNVRLIFTDPQIILSSGQYLSGSSAKDYLLSSGNINPEASCTFVFN